MVAVSEKLKDLAGRQTLRLTHSGRKSGKPYQVTIWFVVSPEKVYIATANVNRQWVRNVKKTPRVKLTIGPVELDGEARFLDNAVERDRVLAMVRQKYWMFLPFMIVGKMLTGLGIIKDTTGAFEVTLANA